ncbi:MAG: hypothetical protein ACXWAT_00760 [Methylobacter sp.]
MAGAGAVLTVVMIGYQKMTDKAYLLERMPSVNDDQLHDFIERVGIKEDSGIEIDTARNQAYNEMMK